MRKKTRKLILALASVCILASAGSGQSRRLRFTINDGWQFTGTDLSGGEKAGIDTSGWQQVNLPHTWNIADTLDDEPGYRRGVSWYRKRLNLDRGLAGKRIFLYFEGVNQTADVYVNEKPVGSHIGGYSAFVFDITRLVDFTGPNTIAVKVDNSLVNDIPPLDADFNMHGGIYRDAWIIATNDVHIKATGMASSGIVIDAPQVSEGSATLSISGVVVNAAGLGRRIEAVSSIVDASGQVVETARSTVNVPANGESNFRHADVRVDRPKLWSPDSPYLYSVRTVLLENGKEIDEVTEPLGLRWFKFDPSEGFFLNGKPLKLRGTNRHQDYRGFGNAVPDDLQVRDLEIIKQTGFNFVRLAHYPQDPSVLAAADRLGLMLWEEIPVVNVVHISEAFNRNSETMLREMIRQHRNHPSVILWGYMNEVFLRAPKTEAQVKATVDLARRLETIAREEDPGRLTAMAFDHGAREIYHSSGLSRITHVVGWNLYFGWYHDTFDDFGKFMDEQHRRFPERPLFVSEYGANADRRVHSLEPKRFDSTTEWQRMYHESYLKQMNERKFISGGAVWNNFDFSSEFRGETIPHINQKGLFTYDRKPKDVAYLYKASFASVPVLHIAARDWPVRSGRGEQRIDVYTNLDEVELFHDGTSLGKKSAGASKKITWEIKLRQGANSFAARGTRNGRSITDLGEITWSDPAAMTDIAVNAGSNAEYVHETGSLWQADRAYAPGSWGFTRNSSKEASNLRNIFATEQDAVAQTAREGSFGYRFDVPDGEYEIELWFAELKNVKSGERVFDVSINGINTISGLDLMNEVGPFTLLSRKFRVSVRDKSGITLDLQPVKGQPIISGLRVHRSM